MTDLTFPEGWGDPSDDTWQDPEQAEKPEPRRWVWDAMEPADRAERLVQLQQWVTWLRTTHELHKEIPECWYRHSAVLERMTALYAGWCRAYINPTPGRDHAELEWITALDSAIPRMKLAACASGHDPKRPPQPVSDTGFTDFLSSAWVTRPAQHPAEAEAALQHP
ncbi:hypothetical protein [Streptomyces bohaiensis]|uniref:hypothetical protein n=1 Tax=Streptomyces bohaiensis TaxID=1431344 RepID=UPI003B79ED75